MNTIIMLYYADISIEETALFVQEEIDILLCIEFQEGSCWWRQSIFIWVHLAIDIVFVDILMMRI